MLAFILTMPGCPSWNGKWSGDGMYFAIVRRNPPKGSPVKLSDIKPYYSFRWSDGWCAGVQVTNVDAKEAAKIRKKSQGFRGYDWMVKSILQHNEIRQDVA